MTTRCSFRFSGSKCVLADANSTSFIVPIASLILTREIVEKGLGANSWAVFPIEFKDNSLSLMPLTK